MLATTGPDHPDPADRAVLSGVAGEGAAARVDRLTELRDGDVSAWLVAHLPSWAARALVTGCGTGVHTQRVAGRFNEVLAVEADWRLVEHARRHRARGNVRYEVRHPHQVTVGEDGRFDVVVAPDVRRHADPATAVAALAHLRSLTRPEGTVLLIARTGPDRTTAPARPPRIRCAAWREFRDDLRSARRPVRDAVELLQLSLDPDLLARQATVGSWTRPDWDDLTRPVFPGARITDLDRTQALVWRAPSPWTRT